MRVSSGDGPAKVVMDAKPKVGGLGEALTPKQVVKADPADRRHIDRAIELSQTKYCGVSEMLRRSAEMTWELVIDPLD